VRAVLRSLIKNTYINRAAQLGGLIDRQVASKCPRRIWGSNKRRSMYCAGADMPAILIELGFLSNKSEERLLEDRSYRKRLIRAIVAHFFCFRSYSRIPARSRGSGACDEERSSRSRSSDLLDKNPNSIRSRACPHRAIHRTPLV